MLAKAEVPLRCVTEAPLELGAVLIGSTPKELVSKARAVVVPTTARADAATVEAVSITLWRVGQVPSVKKLFLLQHAATAATRGGLHRSAVPNTALGTAADAQDGAVDDDDETEGAVPGEPASPPAVRERRDGHSSISGSISVGTPYNVAANDSPFSTAVRESIEAITAPTTAPSEKSAEISSSSAELSGRSLGGKISSLFGAGRGALGKGVEIAGQLREIAKRTDHPLSPAGWAQVASPRTLPPLMMMMMMMTWLMRWRGRLWKGHAPWRALRRPEAAAALVLACQAPWRAPC